MDNTMTVEMKRELEAAIKEEIANYDAMAKDKSLSKSMRALGRRKREEAITALAEVILA
jgi:hypothetical protein